MTEPMTDERLSQIRANAINLWVPGDWNDAAKDVSELLAEVERLKTQETTTFRDTESDDPEYWESGGRVHNWKNHVPILLRENWNQFGETQRALLQQWAEDLADKEEWD